MYLETILSYPKRKIFEKLSFLKKYGWYLAGGTGLALQLGHRISQDFDFYTTKKFRPEEILKKFQKEFPKQVIVIDKDKDTLIFKINDTHLSCFYYPYPLIRPKVLISEVAVASIEDIAAMKMIAVSQRGTKRNFIDLYYLIERIGFKKILSLTLKKYQQFNIYLTLKALTYFDDAERSGQTTKGRRIIIFDPSYSWSKIKKFLLEEVKKYQLSLIKK